MPELTAFRDTSLGLNGIVVTRPAIKIDAGGSQNGDVMVSFGAVQSTLLLLLILIALKDILSPSAQRCCRGGP